MPDPPADPPTRRRIVTQANVELIMAAIADLKQDVRDVNNHLAQLNGRTRKVETGLRVHWVLWTILGCSGVATIPFILERIWRT